MGIEHSRTNYYLIAGISVIIGVLLLVAICVCFMNFCKLLNVFRKSDQTDNQRVSSSFALEEIHPLALNTNNTRIFTASDFPPTYIETTSVWYPRRKYSVIFNFNAKVKIMEHCIGRDTKSFGHETPVAQGVYWRPFLLHHIHTLLACNQGVK